MRPSAAPPLRAVMRLSPAQHDHADAVLLERGEGVGVVAFIGSAMASGTAVGAPDLPMKIAGRAVGSQCVGLAGERLGGDALVGEEPRIAEDDAPPFDHTERAAVRSAQSKL